MPGAAQGLRDPSCAVVRCRPAAAAMMQTTPMGKRTHGCAPYKPQAPLLPVYAFFQRGVVPCCRLWLWLWRAVLHVRYCDACHMPPANMPRRPNPNPSLSCNGAHVLHRPPTPTPPSPAPPRTLRANAPREASTHPSNPLEPRPPPLPPHLVCQRVQGWVGRCLQLLGQEVQVGGHLDQAGRGRGGGGQEGRGRQGAGRSKPTQGGVGCEGGGREERGAMPWAHSRRRVAASPPPSLESLEGGGASVVLGARVCVQLPAGNGGGGGAGWAGVGGRDAIGGGGILYCRASHGCPAQTCALNPVVSPPRPGDKRQARQACVAC